MTTDAATGSAGCRLLVAWFAGTAFVGAAMLFWIQPLFAKMVLPVLGGSPAVWNTAMVFFQAALLGGYAYAHLLARLRHRFQVIVHAACLGLAASALPFEASEAWVPHVGQPPALWLLGLMAVAIGAPFFAASATAPLTLRWFSRSWHPNAGDPYFLYAASNVGSIAVLVAFPFVLEPAVGVGTQALAWAFGFALLAVCVVGCGAAVWNGPVAGPGAVSTGRSPAPLARQRLAWIAYSAVPSGLLLGVTGHISTDIASAPLLWVVPLVLYLLGFVNAFARRPLLRLGPAARMMAWALVLLAVVLPWREPAVVFLPLHLGVFCIVAAACHLELARRRPSPEFLTDYFLCVSLGGLAGGALVALLAPLVFDAILEYPLALVLAAALLPGRSPGIKTADAVIAGVILATIVGGAKLLVWFDWPQPVFAVACVYGILGAFALSRQVRPAGFALCILAFVIAGLAQPWQDSDTVWRGRSFFGVYRVTDSVDPPMRSLMHGTTDHGGQMTGADGPRPTTYHTPASPVAKAFAATQALTEQQRVGIVGLGSGAMAYYRRETDLWRYFEIDPLVVWLAVESGYFQMIPRHDPDPAIVVGDARLTLAREPDRSFDLLIMEAFSSDAIPTHLLTREAVALYLQKLADGGVLLLHISNRLLDLEPVVAAVTTDLGCAAVIARSASPGRDADPTYAASEWVAVAADPTTLAILGTDWSPLEPAGSQYVWRDDHASLVQVVRWTGR
ncbi:MAG: fused MFS/spermidine synthase [Gammaproteobacteria bacterium]|nr:fused MFS/spermidine synthase [Gammaproteobacteria bacterium]